MGRSRATPLILFFLAALLLPAAGARGDLFDILVQDIGGSGVPDLQVGGSSLPQLIEDLINAQGDFSPFAGIPFSASITFAGVPNAIAITVDPTTQTATLSFPILGPGAQVFNFTGTDLFGQIEQFLQDNFAEQLTLFLNAINALALVAVTDGTPLSTTALSANYVFDRFGLHADLTRWERRLADEDAGRPGVRGRIDTYYESIDTDVGDGTAITIAPSLEWVLNDMISVAFQFPIAYHKIEGADILNVHGNLAVPLTFLSPDAGNPWGLRLTPFGSLAGVGSIDMASGGLNVSLLAWSRPGGTSLVSVVSSSWSVMVAAFRQRNVGRGHRPR